LTLRDVAAKVRRIVGREVTVQELPGWLRQVAPPIAGNPGQVERGKPVDDALGEEIIIDPDIIMHDDQDIAGTRCASAVILDGGKSALVFDHEAKADIRIRQALERLPKRGFLLEVLRRVARRSDELDVHICD
jgi:hypothetical protein